MLEEKSAEKFLEKAFRKGAGAVDAATLMRHKCSPYIALAFAAGLDGDTLAERMRMPKDDIEDILDGSVIPTPYWVASFCDLAHATPADAHPVNDPRPAASEIVAAAVMVVEYMRPAPAPEAIIRFLLGESAKAHKLGAVSLFEGMADNTEMLLRAQRILVSTMPRLRHHHFSNDELAQPADIASELAEMVRLVAEGDWLGRIPSDARIMARGEKFEVYRRTMSNALYSMVRPEDAADWVHAYDKNVDTMGYAFAESMIKQDIGIFYPLKQYGSQRASMVLSDGTYVSGPSVVDVFCKNYRMARTYHGWLETQEVRADNLLRDVDRVVEIQQWYLSPQTQNFLRAESNQRHIAGHLDYDELEMPMPKSPAVEALKVAALKTLTALPQVRGIPAP